MVRINGGNSKNAREIITGTERAEPRVADIALPPNLSYILQNGGKVLVNELHYFSIFTHIKIFFK